MTVDVVGQNRRLRRLRLRVRVPVAQRAEVPHPAALRAPLRHSPKSEISSQTFDGGASISIVPARAGLPLRPPWARGVRSRVIGVRSRVIDVRQSLETGLRAARTAARGRKLPQEDAGAEHAHAEPGQSDRTPGFKAGTRKAAATATSQPSGTDQDDRPHLEQRRWQRRWLGLGSGSAVIAFNIAPRRSCRRAGSAAVDRFRATR